MGRQTPIDPDLSDLATLAERLGEEAETDAILADPDALEAIEEAEAEVPDERGFDEYGNARPADGRFLPEDPTA